MFFKKVGDMDVVLYGGDTDGHGDIKMPANGVVTGTKGLGLEVKKHIKPPLDGPGWRNAITAARLIGYVITAISTIILIGIIAGSSPDNVISLGELALSLLFIGVGYTIARVPLDEVWFTNYSMVTVKMSGEASTYAFNALGQGNDGNVFKAIGVYNNAQDNGYESIVRDTELLLKSYSDESINGVASKFSMQKKPKVKADDIVKELNADVDEKRNALMDELEYLKHEHEAMKTFKKLGP